MAPPQPDGRLGGAVHGQRGLEQVHVGVLAARQFGSERVFFEETTVLRVGQAVLQAFVGLLPQVQGFGRTGGAVVPGPMARITKEDS